MMKVITSIFIALTVLTACSKKNFNNAPPNASVSFINAAMDVPYVIVNFTADSTPFYLNQQPIYYGSSFEWGVPAGNTPISIVSSLDTSGHIYFDKKDLQPSGIYSIYLLNGSSKDNILILQDTIPTYKDSTVGVRFINLVADSKPFSINLSVNPPNIAEFSNLQFEQITKFKSYSMASGVTDYNFEIRDQASGDMITSFDWVPTLYKNNTIVITGSEGQNSVWAFQVNNF